MRKKSKVSQCDVTQRPLSETLPGKKERALKEDMVLSVGVGYPF